MYSQQYPGYNAFSIQQPLYGPKDFLESNSIIGKMAFLILVLFGFIILLRLGIAVMAWFFNKSSSPHFINGMVDAKQMLIFKQDPSEKNSVTLARSTNERDGVEFTWSVWLYIDDLVYKQGQYRHVFHKGNSEIGPSGLVEPNNAPGVYIAPNTNALYIIINSYNEINESIYIDDIPLNKWLNVMIRCQNTVIDVYINGVIAQSLQLKGVPKQNYGDVFTSMNGGFSGYISNLWYFDRALGTSDIDNLAKSGPNMKMVGSGGMNIKNPDYLSLRWYFYGLESSK
jgi:hypothetical protein